MANQSPDPPSPTAQNPDLTKPVEGNGQEIKQEATNGGQEIKQEAANGTSDRPFLAPSEPMREEQVQNAVKFLAHSKVRGSPVMYRRSFLERKGLTKEEIDEAFRRVPDPPSNAIAVGANASNQAANLQPQAPVNTSPPAAAPVSSNSVVPSGSQSRFHWSHALLAAGALAASGAGTALFIKSMVVPRLKTWIKKVVAEENEAKKEDESQSILAEQTAEAAKAAATAAAVVAKASEELLNSKHEERKYFEAFMGMMDVQVKEMKTMGEAIRKLESTKENYHSKDKEIEEYIQSSVGNGTSNSSWRTPQVVQPDTHLPSVVTKEVKVNGTSNPDYGAVRPSSAPATVEPAPNSKSYMEIMAMIRRGEKPPNIREINDMPPNPNQQPTKPLLAPKPKPWEVSGTSEENGGSFHANGKDHVAPSEPWWRKKTVKITEIEPQAEESRVPVQRAWIPPQPPSVAVPEAAVAIRQPKSAPQKQQSGEIARSDDAEDNNNASRAETACTSDGDVTVEPESSSSVFKGSYQSEIEEEREVTVEI